jgi:hypothetical protein
MVFKPRRDSFTSMRVTLYELDHLGVFFLLPPGMESSEGWKDERVPVVVVAGAIGSSGGGPGG